VTPPATGRRASLLSCGDVEVNPGHPNKEWGEEDYAFSRLEEVVSKAAWEGCHMLVIAPEWPGPQYPWGAVALRLVPQSVVPTAG